MAYLQIPTERFITIKVGEARRTATGYDLPVTTTFHRVRAAVALARAALVVLTTRTRPRRFPRPR